MSNLTNLTVGPGEGDNEEFGTILTQYRISAGLSRAQVAAQLELSSEYLRLIEKGHRTPALGNMPAMLDMYDVTYQTEGVDRIIFDKYSVKFTSRIRESRYKELPENSSRDARLGQVLRLLITADDATLRDIYRKLIRG